MSSSERPDPPYVSECPAAAAEAASARAAENEARSGERSRTDGNPSSPPSNDIFLASDPASDSASDSAGEPDLVMTRSRLTQFIAQLRGHEQQVGAIMHETDRQVSSFDVADMDSEDDDDDDIEADDDDMDEYGLNDDDEVDEEYVDAEEEEEEGSEPERASGRRGMGQEDLFAQRQALLLADGPFATALRLHTRAQDGLLRLAGSSTGRVNIATMIYGRDVNASVSIQTPQYHEKRDISVTGVVFSVDASRVWVTSLEGTVATCRSAWCQVAGGRGWT